ncbi:hypothetical protein A33M_3146 [Rhodovulum sp. PH10]|nr:hypothetical protein A33M_3146 [Rhodovulum sp. PH10]
MAAVPFAADFGAATVAALPGFDPFAAFTAFSGFAGLVAVLAFAAAPFEAVTDFPARTLVARTLLVGPLLVPAISRADLVFTVLANAFGVLSSAAVSDFAFDGAFTAFAAFAIIVLPIVS